MGLHGEDMTIEGIDSALLIESAQWSMFRAVKDQEGEEESAIRIDNLLDRRLHQPVGQFI